MFVCLVLLVVVSTQAVPWVGYSSIDDNAYAHFVNGSGANACRVYAHWRFMEHTVVGLDSNLSVAALRANPQLVYEWASTVPSFAEIDRRLALALHHGLHPIVEVGEGTVQALPSFKSQTAVGSGRDATPFDPNVVGRDLYLAYMYRYSRAVVARFIKANVTSFQVENELNEAWLAGLMGQRRFQLLGSAWRDFSFLTTLLQTLVWSVKDECKQCTVLQNLHTDIPQWVHDALALPGYYTFAAKRWASMLDQMGMDAYPNMVVAQPCLANRTGQRVAELRALSKLPVIVMETSYPVASAAAQRGTNRTEAAQALCAASSFNQSMQAGAAGFLYFKLTSAPGIQAPPGGYSAQDEQALRFIANLYQENGNPLLLLEYLASSAHRKYLESGRMSAVLGGIAQGFGLIDSKSGRPRSAYFALQKVYLTVKGRPATLFNA